MYKSKILASLLLAGIIGMGGAANYADAAPPERDIRVIPYPEGLDTKSEGASSAPGEINHRDSAYFNHLDFYDLPSNEHFRLLNHYPTYQQTTAYTCGPAAGLTVLYWYGNRDYDEMSVAKGMGTQGYPIGTGVSGMVKFFRDIGWQTKSNLDTPSPKNEQEFKNFVCGYLRQGVPVMVENVKWGGHWRVIIGYETMDTESLMDDVLVMADSYDTCDHRQDGYSIENMSDFFYSWFDHSMLPENEREKPWVTAYPTNKKAGTLFVTDLPQLVPAVLE